MTSVLEKRPYGVLIVHGFRANLDFVRCLEPPLKSLGLPIRMPLLRGHGAASPAALDGVTWQDWVVDAETALQDLLTEVEQVIIVGHSMGGLVALWLAIKYEDRIDSVVVSAAAIQLTSQFAPGRRLHWLAPLMTRMFKQWTLANTYADPTLAEGDTKYPWVPTAAIAEVFEFGQVTRERLPKVTVPTLIMQSRSDTTVAPESAEIIYQAISTPSEQKRILWFEVTDHEMFRDCEQEKAIQAVMNYVKERISTQHVS